MKRLLLLFLFLAVTLFAKVDINSADAKTLQSLPGIGPSKAEAIIEWREANGGFQHARDLQSVNGIGPKTYEAIRDAVEVGDR